MTLTELLAWSVVELSSPKPDIEQVAKALDQALADAAKLRIDFDIRTKNLIRLAQVCGPDERLGGGSIHE